MHYVGIKENYGKWLYLSVNDKDFNIPLTSQHKHYCGGKKIANITDFLVNLGKIKRKNVWTFAIWIIVQHMSYLSVILPL